MMPPAMVSSDDTEDLYGNLLEYTQSTSERDALAYLLRYETLVRQQEAAWVAALAHLEPCIQRLRPSLEYNRDTRDIWCQKISYSELFHALNAIELRECHEEHMKTDRQWMMVLRLITQKAKNNHTKSITWAELVQCYQVCVTGMMTLDHMSDPSPERTRVRNRTLAMLALFEPASTQLFVTATVEETAINGPGVIRQRPTKIRMSTKVKRIISVIIAAAMIVAAFSYHHSSVRTAVSTKMVVEEANNCAHDHLVSSSTFDEEDTVLELITSYDKPTPASPSPFKHSNPLSALQVVTSPAVVGTLLGMMAAPLLVPLMAANSLVSSALYAVGIISIGRLLIERIRQFLT